MGEALRRTAGARGRRGRATALLLSLVGALVLVLVASPAAAQADGRRFEEGRFTVIAYPGDEPLARTLLARSLATDTFPGLPRSTDRVLIAIAPDRPRFREWLGSAAPEWGAAFAFPDERRIIMQGSRAGSDAGDPVRVLRHELAHLALYEYLGGLPPRWFQEGYASFAAGEWARDQVIATNLALAVRGVPTLDALDSGFHAGATQADAAYALAYRVVAELSALDEARGLALFLRYWKEDGDFELGIRRAYGMTQSQFEQRFRDRTRRRYGGLALFADFTVASLVILFIVGPFYVIRRRRNKARLAALLAADAAAERRERERIIELLLRGMAPGDPEPSTPPEEST